MTLKILDAARTAQFLPFPGLVDALRAGFTDGCQFPERHHHAMKRTDEPDATLLLMPAWTNPDEASQFLGVKLVTVVPGNASRGLPGLVSTYILYDGLTGEQLALMDGNTITGRRTVATSALAAKYLSRPDSSRLLVIGAGRVGSLIPEAYRAVRPIEEVKVWDMNQEATRRMVQDLEAKGIRATAVEDLRDAVAWADIVSSATLATEPIIKGDWLRPGTHVDLIGGFTPKMREADDATIAASALYVDTQEALHEAGDLVQPMKSGLIDEKSVRATLAELARADIPVRRDTVEITCFKAVGSALADLVAAKMVYREMGGSE
ncbi:UNVERIFIED_ORG: ornithine cyclodeaminase/alanine dehydrogenase-like protein (mu-crystallin family) [Rhizobium sophorae]|uniref:ornithine cyclodeaminase family protein n=1 Tax=Rhizobium leguminosarum TaxID=384 RepID=UPI00103A3A62|nr:ornithine cyclodeaminase family protein [Rhizobium leguminosarum]MDH6659133.1 ornithine cyclodeaminase/alanine dehydrogenase-like protein (mu-crystallin family) [Rhizobium sophorae]MBB4523032.1 ornithine cyclodeaminase [Rhizobium leguminosarum]TBZ49154.1 ornithine cyclodeaminase family protein [Rhizobium leguminosarum bv. viciae]TCA19791.1 ornithine cyclodeaminase family protein [Rhizobium leguminosarum bv. viciae]TCA23984.1 ornithine cyclodeaminase family protein [Rhizobium leguminosarum b